MIYNIRGARGSDDRIDLDRVAGVIEPYGADIVALQEVDVNRARSGRIAHGPRPTPVWAAAR